MTKEPRRVSFDEFANNTAHFFMLVIHEHEPVVVENEDGRKVEIRPLSTVADEPTLTEEHYPALRSDFGERAAVDTDSLKKAIADYDPDKARAALRKSVGALRGVNREELLADIHEERGQNSQGRPA